MKILFISDVYFPRINGVSTSIETFRHELRALGHTVHLIAPQYATPSADESGILRVPAKQVPLDPEDRYMSFKWVMQQLDKLQSEQYDIIHVQTPFVAHYLGLKLSKLLNIPCIETYHTFFEEYLYHYIPLLPKQLLRMAAQRFSRHQGNSLHGLVVPSHPMLDILKRYGISTRMEVIATGIEPDSFRPGDRIAFRQHYEIPQQRPVLLFVGRVAHEKNIDFLLQVLLKVRLQLPDVLLLIAGEGPARNSLQQQASALGLNPNIMFIGYLERHNELNNCYRAADLFVFSSRTETQGLVLLEAMAQGTAVVSTAELGTRDVLKEGQGVWIAKEETTEFSEKIITLLGNDELRADLGKKGREYALGWSASKQAERLLSFYQQILTAAAQSRTSGVNLPLQQHASTKINQH